MSRYPFMPISHPAPIPSQPNVAGLRRNTDDFLTRRRGRDHDNPASIMPLVGNNDAPHRVMANILGKPSRECGNAYRQPLYS